MAVPSSRRVKASGRAAALTAAKGTDAQALLGRPPPVRGEEESAYAELLARVQASVIPKDVLEKFWVRDVIDLS